MGISKKHLRRSKKSNVFLCERLEPRILLDGDCGDDSGDDSGDSSSDPFWGLFDTGQITDSSNPPDSSTPDDGSDDGSYDAPILCPPAAPSHLTLQSPSSSKIFLSWQNNSDDQNSVRIKRLNDNGTYTTLATLNGNATSFTDSGLQTGTAYSYVVVTLNSAGRSDFSNVATFTLANPTDPTLIGQFGHLPGGKASVPFSFVDTDGTQILLKLTGPGVGSIHLTSTGYNLMLTGTILASSVQITTTPSHTPGDDGRFQLTSLIVGDPSNVADHTALGTLSAKTTDLDGNLTVTGPASNLTLGNITNGELLIDSSNVPSTSAINLNFGHVTNTSIDTGIGIRSLSAIRWSDTGTPSDLITAPFLQNLSITGQKGHGLAVAGDFDASMNLTGTAKGKVLSAASINGILSDATWNLTGKAGTITASSATNFSLNVSDSSTATGDLAALTLTNSAGTSNLELDANSIGNFTVRGNLINSQLSLRQNVSRKQPALGTLLVKGSFATSELRTAGNINSLTIGVLDHTLLFAGIQDALTSLPASPSDFANPAATISNLKLTGFTANSASPVLINSDIAAVTIRHVTLPHTPSAIQDLDQTTPFGFATLRSPVTQYTGPASIGNYISGKDAAII